MLATPLVFYPTTLLWVDDDELFLQAVTEGLKSEYNVKTFCNPQDAVNYFQKHQSVSSSVSFLRGYTEYEEYDLNDHLPVDINLNTIHKLRENPHRLQDNAVMVLDYNMPEMTGIELCYELRGLPIKKILLTGEADNQLAINAFNDGVIDCFIRKDDPELTTNLLFHIKKLTMQYFHEMTKPLLTHLEADYKLPQSDPVFSDFFNQWRCENNICEYYVVDKNGTLLTVNEKGMIQYFVTHTNRSLNVFTELYADDADVSAFIQKVNQRNKIPFFGIKKEPWNYEFRDWGGYFYSPEILEGREKYYWTVIEDQSSLNDNKLNVA